MKNLILQYDLTEIQEEKLRELFEAFGVSLKGRRSSKLCAYVFKGPDIEVRFGAHPFKQGLLWSKGQGTRGAGYCSYVGIDTRDNSFFNEFQDLVNNHGCTKEGPCFEPQFI